MDFYAILVIFIIGVVVGWLLYDRIKITYKKPDKKEDDTKNESGH